MYLNIKPLKNIRKMNKRGNILDIFFIAVVIAGLAIFFLILGFVVGSVTDKIKESGQLNTSEHAKDALDYSSSLIPKFDYAFFMIFIGLVLGTLISSALIYVHKIFVPIYIFLFMMAIIVGVIMNNVYTEFTENAILASHVNFHPFANAIINNYVLVLIGVGVLSMILLFGKIAKGDERM